MKKIINTLAVAALAAASSCQGFLEPYPSAIRSTEYVLDNPTTLAGLVGECYEYMSKNYDNNEGAFLDAASDNAVRTSLTDGIHRFAVGQASTGNDLFQTYWDRDYKGIYNCNLFLKDRRGIQMTYMLDPARDELLKNRLWGEAYALRAWFQWDLLQKFGGKGTDGQLLGYPIVLEPVKIWEMTPEEIASLQMHRASYEDCVKQIVADCDSAYKYLPLAHRDFLASADELTVLGSQNWGRMDGITTRAIKALVYLTWASPRFNPEGDMSRWQKAAEWAAEVMDFKMNVDNVSGGFNRLNPVNWFNPNDPEIIFASRYSDGSEAMEKAFWPGGFQGNGAMGATEDLVEAFGMADGYPLGQSPNLIFDPENPYENRDARLYSNIFYNGRTVTAGSSAGRSYTFENWTGGKDAAGADSRNSRTNYHIKKFVYMGLNWSESPVNRMPHTKFFIRWTHMALSFAEAANELGGPDEKVAGMTAREVMRWIRQRMTYDGAAGLSEDPYLDEVALSGKAAFREFIHNERRIETCFEGLRFFDLRRWSTTLGVLNTPVHGVSITKGSDGSFTYRFDNVVDIRSFSSAYLPIPYKEMRNVRGLVQNEGWESWQ